MMKIGKYMICILAAGYLSVTGCMKIDNFDAPAAKIQGRIIDKTTGKNMYLGQAESHIRIWEVSYRWDPEPQDLRTKADGTYYNDKLFTGTYDMLPYNGAWWPCDTLKDVKIMKKGAVQDFEVTPYLHLIDFYVELDGLNLTMSCKLQAPITENMPRVIDIRPFVSNNSLCGLSSRLDYYYSDDYRIRLNKEWQEIDSGNGVSKETYSITVPLKAGYKYTVRMGALVDYTFTNYNYTETVEVKVPKDAE